MCSRRIQLIRLISASLLGLLTLCSPSMAQDQTIIHAGGDIREFRVGVSVSELPTQGYRRFACGQNGQPPVQRLEGWQDYATCPADDEGLYEVAFQYDNDDAMEGIEDTGVAGHPVIISLLFNLGGIVDGIRVFSDPEANNYNKRRAYILGRIARNRYGWQGFKCIERPRKAGEFELGGIFHKDRCVKDFGDRTITIEKSFYRVPDGKVNKAFFEIRRNVD